jgi:hypothetical protein
MTLALDSQEKNAIPMRCVIAVMIVEGCMQAHGCEWHMPESGVH